jgi:hypothetical protein
MTWTNQTDVNTGDTIQATRDNQQYANMLHLKNNSKLLIAETIVADTAVQQVDFTGLSIYEAWDLEMMIYNSTGGQVGYSLYANDNVTATNYEEQIIYGSGASALANRANDGIIAVVPATVTNIAWMKICNTKQVAAYKHAQALGQYILGTGASFECRGVAWEYISDSQVTKLSIKGATASSIGIGSWFRVYSRYVA